VADILTVTRREATGKRSMRKLRNENLVPGVFYQPGKESIPLSIPNKEIERVVRQNSREVTLDGDLKSNAQIKALQWDAFGSTVLHVDLVPSD
jgi:ribosomal protein L25 (general stress protein Ctc)